MTGMIMPSPALAVWALKALQKSMMFTPCCPSAGPTGGAGVALPAGMCSLTYPTIFLAISRPRVPSGDLELLDLQEIQFDGRRSPEDRDHHLQRRPVLVDLVHDAGEVGERAVHDPDRVSPLELELRLRLLRRDRDLVDDAVHLLLRERRRLDTRADEAGHLRGVLHHVPGGVVHLHVDQHVSRKELLLRDDLGAVAHLDDVLG